MGTLILDCKLLCTSINNLILLGAGEKRSD